MNFSSLCANFYYLDVGIIHSKSSLFLRFAKFAIIGAPDKASVPPTMIHKEIDVNKPLIDAQIAMLQALEARPDEPDTDCPELTEA